MSAQIAASPSISKWSTSARPRLVTMRRSYIINDFGMRDGCRRALHFRRMVHVLCPATLFQEHVLHNGSRFTPHFRRTAHVWCFATRFQTWPAYPCTHVSARRYALPGAFLANGSRFVSRHLSPITFSAKRYTCSTPLVLPCRISQNDVRIDTFFVP